MNLQGTKMGLIEMLIKTNKTTVLKKVKAILIEEQNRLTQEEYKLIDTRRESHLKGESNSFSWQEVKRKIQSR